jgi:hypothetical protein
MFQLPYFVEHPMYAVCGAVEAATETTLSTLSSVAYIFLGFISLVFEQNSAHLTTVLLLIIGMLLFLNHS